MSEQHICLFGDKSFVFEQGERGKKRTRLTFQTANEALKGGRIAIGNADYLFI